MKETPKFRAYDKKGRTIMYSDYTSGGNFKVITIDWFHEKNDNIYTRRIQYGFKTQSDANQYIANKAGKYFLMISTDRLNKSEAEKLYNKLTDK